MPKPGNAPVMVEAFLIAVIIAAIYFIAPVEARACPVGRLALYASGALLAQSLCRDLTLLWRRRADLAETPRKARCMCLESTVGMAGIVVGALLVGLASGFSVSIAQTGWAAVIGVPLIVGLLIKDLVLTWPPLRIQRDPDHMNIIVKW